jgi:prepilin-type N-terminal cleavage/methylation domain-containing protein
VVRSLSRAVRRLRVHPEGGFTLLEMTVSLLIMGIVTAAVLSVLFTVQRGYERESYRSQSNDQARLAVEEMDRQIRSGNLLYDPALEGSSSCPNQICPNMSLRVYTQNNATTHQPGDRCVQWRVNELQQLQVRDWSPSWRDDGIVDPWRIVADHVVNRALSPQVNAFVLDTDPAKGGRAVQITIVTNQSSIGGRNVTIQTEVTGRDTEYGYPNYVCTDVPPY